MRLFPAGPIARLSNRLSLKAKLIGTLALVGIALAVSAYFVMATLTADRLDDRLASRSSDLATAMSATSSNDDQLLGVVASLARLDEVRSIAFVGAAGQSELVAVDGSGSIVTDPTRTKAGATLVNYVASGELPASGSDSPALRVVLLGNPFEPTSMQPYIAAIELDEEVVGADLISGMLQALSLLIAGVAVVLVAAHLLFGILVSRRLKPLAHLDESGVRHLASAQSARDVRDEVLLIRQSIGRLFANVGSATEPRNGVEYILPETLPDIWLRISDDLKVTDVQIGADDVSSNGDSSIVLDDLSDLLSADVVDHVVSTLDIIDEGEEETFEFSVGVKSYRALMRAEAGSFTLEISESPADVHAVQPPTLETAEILAGLLEHLPVGVLDTDAHGAIRYANRPLFGAESSDSLVGRSLPDVLPQGTSEAARRAIREARRSQEPQRFSLHADAKRGIDPATVHVVPITTDADLSFFVLSIDALEQSQESDGAEKVRAMEQQLWELELKVSDYEERIAELSAVRVEPVEPQSVEIDRTAGISADVIDPMRDLLAAAVAQSGQVRSSDPDPERDVLSAVLSVARVLDDQLGTNLIEASQEFVPPDETRFHLATMLDEIAIAASERNQAAGSRISVFVQPSLPKWLYGNERESQAAILQMIEFAQLVASDRPLILAAMQDASEGRSVRVRFEVQIPPPVLDDDDMAILRGCITGEVPDDGLPSSISRVLQESASSPFDALDIELVKINDEATALRSSSNFEIAEEFDSDHSWVRGLRTLIIQEPGSSDNGIQAALSAFGIIGYVVSDEEDLVNALHLAEEYSNPYRFVLADVDTPHLESFVGQLFDGDAPVVLVGKKSESAMVGAISAGYSGYIAKPVRQVELLEVILSTVEPPEQSGAASNRASAA